MRAAPRFGPYQVVRELARGGMGVVYEAVHGETGARHALKTIMRGAEAEEVARFRREAEVLGRLDHPHIVRVHAAEHVGATPWMAQDLLAGGTLEARLARGPLPIAEATALARKLADALAHAHARGVLHRDLKPSNVVFDDRGEPRLIDFGIGRALDSARLTATGTVLGTPGYLAPELVLGERDDDARTDVYGLGALLYAAVTGRPPFEGASAVALLKAVTEKDPPPLRRARPDAPAWLEAVVARAMARRPEERFQDAAALARALETGPTGVTGGGRRGAALAALLTAAVAVIGLVLATRDDVGVSAPPGEAAAVRSTARLPERPAAPAAPARAAAADVEAILSVAARGDRKGLESLLARAGALEPADARRVATALMQGVSVGVEASRRITLLALGGDAQARLQLVEYFASVGLAQRVDPSFLVTETEGGPYQHFLWAVMEPMGASLAALVGDLLVVAPDDPVLLCFDAHLRVGSERERATEVLVRQLARLRGPTATERSRWLRIEVLDLLGPLLPPPALRVELERELELAGGDLATVRELTTQLERNARR